MSKPPPLVASGIILGIVSVCGVVLWTFFGQPKSPSETPEAGTIAPAAATRSGTNVAPLGGKRATAGGREVSVGETNTPAKVSPPIPPATRGAIVAPPEIPRETPSGPARELLARLTQLTSNITSLSPEQAAEINTLLKQLVEEGNAAIPSIREFLQQNNDFNFDSVTGGNLVNYGTLRLGLIDALQQIASPEAIQLSAAILQTTAEPVEIAQLSRFLEQQAPGQFRQLELTAGREALTQFASGQLPARDASPVFELLQAYGDASVVPDLEKAVARWNYYATIALAGLPDGAGIPTLIKLSQDPAISSLGNGDIALRPLAQVAMQYPDAARALIDEARQNQISDAAWASVTSALSGSYIQYGNQLFGSTSPAPNWSSDQITQRISMLNQMLAVTPNPTGRQALQNALASLSARLPK